jgi:hypothetical protein
MRILDSAAEAVFGGGGAPGTLVRVLADDVPIDGIEGRTGSGVQLRPLDGR